MRELLEETGIAVNKFRYFGREPWPFPDSFMVGFTADFARGELAVDTTEIESAFWFDRNHLPRITEKLSISRVLIDGWMENGRSSSPGVSSSGTYAASPAGTDKLLPPRSDFFHVFLPQPCRVLSRSTRSALKEYTRSYIQAYNR